MRLDLEDITQDNLETLFPRCSPKTPGSSKPLPGSNSKQLSSSSSSCPLPNSSSSKNKLLNSSKKQSFSGSDLKNMKLSKQLSPSKYRPDCDITQEGAAKLESNRILKQRDVSHSSSSSSGREGRRVDLGPPSGKEGGRGELGPSSGRESERNTGGRGYPEDLYSTRINAEGEDGWGAPNEGVARREGGRGSTPGRLTAPPACFSPLRFCAYFSLFSFVLIIFDNLSGKSLSLLRALLISTYSVFCIFVLFAVFCIFIQMRALTS